jgi:HEPN superfamily Swt1-like protein
VATNPRLKEALLKKLGVTPQALSARAKKRKKRLPMSTEQAVYTIAHDEGLDLSKYLTKEETTEVRDLVAQLGNSGPPNGHSVPPARKSGPVAPKHVVVSIAGVKFGDVPGLKASHAQEAKAMAERVYPTLYLFENSVRDFIERVLSAKYGTNWWNIAVHKKVRDKAEGFKEDEKKDTWHGKRGRRDLDYLLLSQLWTIIRDKWKDFEPFFPQGAAWVQNLIENDMNVSRRVFAHMNPLDEDDIKGLEASFRKWVKHLKAIEDKLP